MQAQKKQGRQFFLPRSTDCQTVKRDKNPPAPVYSTLEPRQHINVRIYNLLLGYCRATQAPDIDERNRFFLFFVFFSSPVFKYH